MAWKKKSPKHKLAIVGDSITQGFQNGGIYRTDLNFPAFLIRCFEPEPEFHQPLFSAQGGIPLNLEVLVRGLSDEYGNSLQWNEYLPAMHHIYTTLRRVKNYWEGNVKDLRRPQPTPFHNQSVWGFTISDAWLVNEKNSHEHIERQPETYSVFNVLPDHAMYTTARLTLNPTLGEKYSEYSQMDNIRHLQENGGIENLIATMGHNNIIGAVTDLRFQYSEAEDLEAFPSERSFTVYRPEHFEIEYRKFAEKVSKVGAQRVITQTIPYVTIPPVSRGVNEDRSTREGTYFDYYTRFWIWDSDFNPEKHPYLSREQAVKLDHLVDEYNKIIRDVADQYGWIVVPLNKYLSAIARRRRKGGIQIPYPEDFCRAIKANPETEHLIDGNGNMQISTDFLRIDEETGKLYKGGIFSLDGIHPTTIGYGLIAHVYYEAMENNGINFQKPLDWDFIIKNDSLVTDPPYLLVELRNLLRFLSMGRQERFLRIGSGLLHQLMKLFTQRNVPAEKQA